MRRAIVLLSGGVDSSLTLALAKEKNLDCHTLSFDYGQRHKIELESAKNIAAHYAVPHKIIYIDPTTFSGSALTSGTLSVPKNRTPEEIKKGKTPITYVPARNTLFIAYALVHAEILRAEEVHLGPNLDDQTLYPDCHPLFYAAFQKVANLASQQATEGGTPHA